VRTNICGISKKYALVCVDILHGDVDRLFHYAIPQEVQIQVGQRVHVPFGKGNKPILGYVIEISDVPGAGIPLEKIKFIESVADGFPVLTEETLALALWMREKYYCILAAAIRCVVPSSKADGRFPMARRKIVEVEPAQPPSITLTQEQQHAVDVITSSSNNGVILLHGVTGSGKTEVYMHTIRDVLAQGRQAIVLVPEIALTPQMVQLFTARFGSRVAVTHSRLTAGERFQIWKLALDGEIELVIGPRSAVFTPFANLGLIVIDEEHEHTYHSETTPKYDARKVAIKRGELAGATVVLGSATPSLESYLQATESTNQMTTPLPGGSVGGGCQTEQQGLGQSPITMEGSVGALCPTQLLNQSEANGATRQTARPVDESYESGQHPILIELPERINKSTPDVTVIDMRKEAARGNMSIFAVEFQTALVETITSGRQAILFLNRRGHSSFVSCRWCGFVLTCNQCRVNHTYHADKNRMLCHYCGKGTEYPKTCPACSSKHIKLYGMGTQKIEEEVKTMFHDIGILRMDMDTTRGKLGHAKVLDTFRNGEAQVLIGTQMVAKGLDFPNVTMVGVVAADLSLHTGDFRAAEHTFQLLTQVSGRAGRAMHSGRVFLQTYNPEHYAIEFAKTADYKKFYEHEIAIRRAMVYPPFSHVFSIMFSGATEKDIIVGLQKLQAIMAYCNHRDNKQRFDIIGISPAFVSKVKNLFRWKLLVKCVEEEPLKAFVLYCIRKLKENDPLTGITIHMTLDPIVME